MIHRFNEISPINSTRRHGFRLKKRLIVTADDFGAAVSVNEAIEAAHRQGILTTASLMVGAAATEDAVRRARRLPALRVGLHLVLVRGRPLLPPATIPRLVGADGRLRDNLVRAGFSFFCRPSARRQLKAEIRAQFRAFHQTGLVLDHVNAHNHLHLHPTVLGLILREGKEYGLSAVRLPHEPLLASWRAAREGWWQRFFTWWLLAPWLRLLKIRLGKAGVACNDHAFGLNDSGRMEEDRVLGFLAHLPAGVTEMYFHPATGPWWDQAAAGYRPEGELLALTSKAVAAAVAHGHIELATFSRQWSAVSLQRSAIGKNNEA